MADKEQPVDINVFDEIKKIKNLERELRGYDFSPDLDSNSLIGFFKDSGVTQQESEEFFRGYSNFAGNYVSELIDNRLKSFYDTNKNSLENLSKEAYAIVYDVKLDGLQLSTRVNTCFKFEEIEYLGQLLQMKEIELLRIPWFGRGSLNEVKKFLKGWGLGLGMEINYKTPEERK